MWYKGDNRGRAGVLGDPLSGSGAFSVRLQLYPGTFPEPWPFFSTDQDCDSQESMGKKEGWRRSKQAPKTRCPMWYRETREAGLDCLGNSLREGFTLSTLSSLLYPSQRPGLSTDQGYDSQDSLGQMER
jgi:hypothetical protein